MRGDNLIKVSIFSLLSNRQKIFSNPLQLVICFRKTLFSFLMEFYNFFLLKARIREIPAKDKLQYLYCLLSAVLPIVKRIHAEQCSEVELEKRLRGMMLICSSSMLGLKFP